MGATVYRPARSSACSSSWLLIAKCEQPRQSRGLPGLRAAPLVWGQEDDIGLLGAAQARSADLFAKGREVGGGFYKFLSSSFGPGDQTVPNLLAKALRSQ
ncbi:MAG: hypothetical protein ACI8X5_000441 [Planctomycetota bacterium]|jgi:hypothetical protein